MTTPHIIQSFNAGEISPELYGQVALAKYSSAATTLRNCFVGYRGGATSRGGLAFVGRCKQTISGTGPPRPISFAFSITQGYILEFGDNYLRFVYQGGYVLESPITILGAGQADPCQISVTGTPFTDGDWVFISAVQGMTELNGNTYIVAGVTSGSFTLEDLNGNPVNSLGFSPYTGGGAVARLYTLTTPYAAIDLPYLKVAQSADVMSLTCSNPVSGTEYPQYDLTRFAADDWTVVQIDFDAVIVPPTTVSAAANAQAPSTGINATFAYQVTAVDVNGNESVASVVASCHGADIEVEGGTNTITWSMVSGATYYNIYRSPASVDTGTSPGTANPVPAGSIFGFVGSSYGTQFLDTSSTTDLSQVSPTHQDPFAPGQIEAVDITGPGSGLTDVTWTITSADGSGFAGYPVITSGQLSAFPETSPGKNYQPGDSIAFNGEGTASGAIKFATNPSNTDTITLNSVTWTFVTGSPSTDETQIGTTLKNTLSALVSGLSASPNPDLTVASYAVDSTGANLLITYNTPGTGGNAYTLAASAAIPTGTNASGTLTFTINPTNGQTIVLNGITWTFVTSGATGTQTNIQGTLAETLTQLASDLINSANGSIDVATYGASATVLTITYKTASSAGDSYTITGGTSGATPSGATLSGASETLTGGSGSSGTAPTATLNIGPTSGTYPGVNAYFQERHFFANSFNDPDTVWASQTALYVNFDTRIPSQATDAITASPWTEQVNGIQWLVPMPGGLIAMTGQRAWQIIGEGSYQLNVQPVTPSTTQAQPQAFNGCSATIPPIVIDYDVIYVQATGDTTVRDLSWNFWVNIYTGADLTILSSQLFLYRQILQWAWSREPYKILWAVRDDGTMLSLTYLKEQEVYGWARHDTQGLVVGVASVTEPPVDATYVITQRFPPYAPQGIYVMERMDNRIWQSVEDAYAVDSAVSNPMVSPSTYLYAVAASGNGVIFTAGAATFTNASVGQVIRLGGGIATVTAYTDSKHVVGNWLLGASNGAPGFPFASAGNWTIAANVGTLNAPHLAGMTVVGLADGVPISPLVVGATGLITLPFQASNVKVGLGFMAQVQSPYLNPPTIQGQRKVIPAATLRVAASGSGFQYGTNQPDGAAQNPPQIGPAWNGLTTVNTLNATGGQKPPPSYTNFGGQPVTQLWTGDIRVVGGGGEWNSKGQVAVQQALPMALELTAIVPESLDGDTPEETYSQKQPGPGGQQQPRPPGMHMLRI